MTSEVAVINKSAVALAADSAVTIENHDSSGNRADKIFNTANKLFTLSKYQPVGIMVNNTMEIGGVPWETVIKEYRNKELKDKDFGTLEEYKDDFFRFMEGSRNLFPKDRQEEILFIILLRYFLRISPKIKSNKDARNIFQHETNKLEKEDFALGFDENYRSHIEKVYKPIIDKVIGNAFKVSHVKNLKSAYRRLSSLILTKKKLLEGHSGIVFAGFGLNEAFPTVSEYSIDAIFDNRLKMKFESTYTPSNTDNGKVLGFAQDDIIKTILRGINPGYFEDLVSETIALIINLPNEIIDKISELNGKQKESYKNDAKTSVLPIAQDFFKSLNEKAYQKHAFQIERAISFMPFSELATVAEVFINLTQIRQRMSPEAETVGGPIDVAVISKADGFIWIKRKHYFSTDLNYTFLQNYFR